MLKFLRLIHIHGLLRNRDKKEFKCLHFSCKHVDHTDVNVSFNIAKASVMFGRLTADRDVVKGCTGEAQVALNGMNSTTKPLESEQLKFRFQREPQQL